MKLVERAKNILLTPSTEWPVIDGEVHTVKGLYTGYLLPLAGVTALATFLGAMLWGVSLGPVSVRFGFGDALGQAITGFVLSMVLVWVLGWIINTLAPTFKGQKSFEKAFAVAAFAMTGALVGGMAAILPALSTLLGLIGGLYSLYLMYKGLPVLMKSPPEKSLGYTAVIVIAAIICNVILVALFARLGPNPGAGIGAAGSAGTTVTINTPAGPVGTTQAKLEDVGRKLEEAARQAQKASEAQDATAVSKAAGDAIAAITGAMPGGNRVALSIDTLRGWLPERLAGLPRETFDVQGGSAVGIAGSTARATYRDGDRRVELEVLDAGGASGVLAMISNLAIGERETETTVEKSYQADKRRVTEKRWKNGERAEYNIVLANGVVVSAKGTGVGFDVLAPAIRGLGLEKLEAAGPAKG
ncbi:MAG: Yip1 family protein [Lautropia sp.]